MKLLGAFSLGILSLVSFNTAKADSITVRGDAWCPYNCEPGAKPGYGIEVMQEAFKVGGHTVDYKIEPWNRALANVKSGKEISAIGASTEDVNDNGLKVGTEGIGSSKNCIYVAAGSKAKYSKPEDLAQFKKIGVITDYTYNASIDKWVKDPANKSKLDVVAGDSAVATNARKLGAGRLEAVIEDSAVMGYTLKQLSMDGKVAIAGCTESAKIFVAFSPANPKTAEYIKILDDGVVSLRKSGKLKQILEKYGAKDWK
jgi:polar amino acid transport system substrate-binding protein